MIILFPIASNEQTHVSNVEIFLYFKVNLSIKWYVFRENDKVQHGSIKHEYAWFKNTNLGATFSFWY